MSSWSTDWPTRSCFNGKIIPMSTGYNPQYTANKQGFCHRPPRFFKRCLSETKSMCTNTQPLGSWMIRGETGAHKFANSMQLQLPKSHGNLGFPSTFLRVWRKCEFTNSATPPTTSPLADYDSKFPWNARDLSPLFCDIWRFIMRILHYNIKILTYT